MIVLSEKAYEIPDIKPTYIKINMRFVDGDWKPTKIAIQVEDDEGTKNGETDSGGKVTMNIKGDDAKILLSGKTESK